MKKRMNVEHRSLSNSYESIESSSPHPVNEIYKARRSRQVSMPKMTNSDNSPSLHQRNNQPNHQRPEPQNVKVQPQPN